jgi:predicted ATPase/DNA-binding winged helix-turn-helix (wHTH) protein
MAAGGLQAVYDSGACEIDLARRELRVLGSPVPLGARAFGIIEALARAAGALVTKEQLMVRVWPDVVVNDNTLQVHISAVRKALGPHRAALKTESGRGYRLLGGWAPRDSPAQMSTQAPRPALREVAATSTTNIPAAVTDLVGRAGAVQLVRDLLSAYRIVTLAGPGGIGKTVLGLRVASELLDEFADGVWLTELGSLSDPEFVPSAVAVNIGLKLGDAISANALARAVGSKKMLIILDNCEHLIEATAALAEVLAFCPQITILATSREPLRVQGEYVYRVPALDVPATDKLGSIQIQEHSAPELFIIRAREYGSDLSSSDRYSLAVAAICRHLDGIPLAIEFAAARAATLGVEQVAIGLRDHLASLTSGRRTALPRHRTLRATLDWSYQLLTEMERDLLRRLAIFVAPFSLEAAFAVAAEGVDSSQVADGVADLVAKSLIVRVADALPAQFRLLETTRAYARERLIESGDLAGVARRHAHHLLRVLPTIDDERRDRPTSEYLVRVRRRADEIQVALEWALGPSGDSGTAIALTIAAFPLWFDLLQMSAAHDWALEALSHVDSGSRQEMQLRIGSGYAMWYMTSEHHELESTFARALELAERLGDSRVRIQALWGMWAARRANGDYRSALPMARRYADAAREAGDAGAVHLGDRILGVTYHYMGRQDLARQFTERALGLPQRIVHAGSIGYQLETPVAMATLLARILWLQGFPDQALVAAREAINAGQQSGLAFPVYYAITIAGLPTALWVGALDEADNQVDTLRELGTDPAMEAWVQCFSGVIRLRRGDARDALIAAFFEARIEYWTIRALAELVSKGELDQQAIPTEHGAMLWNTPELLRVDAEWLLARGAPGAAAAAEAKLLQAIEIAQEQMALSWELRAVMSLAGLRARQARAAEGRDLLLTVYERFQEGFGTSDLIRARALLEDLRSTSSRSEG